MQSRQEHELEQELEFELQQELENENEGELGESENALGEFEAEGGLGEFEAESGLGEFEAESELGEFETENEVGELETEAELGEHEQGEQFLGGILSGIGSLFGQGESELGEFEAEFEQGEQFFGKIARRIARIAQSAAPILKRVARIAAPIAGKAVGGLFGGPAGAMLGSKLARLAAQQLREQELGGAHELENEFELGEHEAGEQELGEHEVSHELAEHEAQAEAMAHYAAFTESEHEAEALVGAAVTVTLSARDRRALRALVPNLVRGAAILTRILRMRRATRPFVRVVPTIVRRTVRTLRRGAAAGQPITRRRAGDVMARQTRRVLSSPRFCAAALRRNIGAAKTTGRGRSVTTSMRRNRSF